MAMAKYNNPYLPQALLLGLGLNSWSLAATDPDLGWQLFGGAWMLDHGGLPSFDPINTFGSSWHNYHWLGQIILYKIFLLGGYPALRFVFGLLMAWLFIVISDIALISIGRRKSNLLQAVFAVAACLGVYSVFSIRPQIIGLLIVALAYRLILSPRSPTTPVKLFLLTLLLANIHVYWVFIPFVFAAIKLLPCLIHKRKPSLQNLLTLSALTIAGGLTPYGTKGYSLILEYAFLPQLLRNSIMEFRPTLAILGMPSAILLLALLVAARTWSLKRVLARIGPHSVTAFSAILAISSIKFFGLFAVLAIPGLIARAGVYIRKYAPNIFYRDHLLAKIAILGPGICGLALATINNPSVETDSEALTSLYPLSLCSQIPTLALASKTGRNHLRIATHFNHGGWCRWSAYLRDPEMDIRVTTDGRTQWVPVNLYKISFDLYGLRDGWQKTLELWKPDAIIAETNSPLTYALELLGDTYNSIHSDNFVLFTPKIAK